MIRHLLLASSAILACVVGATSLQGQAPAKTTNSGVYTAAQAERGKKTFEAKCTACHDTARFTGEIFFESWNNKTMKDIWDVASGTMPEDNPGSLKQNEYADILAYFLELNAFPAGDAELLPGAAPMATIKIEKKP
jgi:mono/diheme cytochrome c family protein